MGWDIPRKKQKRPFLGESAMIGIIRYSLALFVFFINGMSALGQQQQSENQDKNKIQPTDWSRKIIGNWQINRAKTATIWRKTYLKDATQDILPMFPFVPEHFHFRDDGVVSLGEMVSEKPEHQPTLKNVSFDSANKQLKVSLANDFGTSMLVFDVVGENELILHASTFIAGPTRVVYRRSVDSKDDITRDILDEMKGEWVFKPAMTKYWWSRKLGGVAEAGQKIRLNKIQDEIKTLLIKDGRISFANGTTEFLKSVGVNNSSNQTYKFIDWFNPQQEFEIVRIHKQIIKLVDTRRQFVGIYSQSDKNEKLTLPHDILKNHNKSRLVQSFENIYEKRVLPPLDDRVEKKYINNTVEIESIRIERQFAANAVKHADITNMAIELFVDTGFNNRVCDGQRIKITKLATIFDNSGKLLLTDQRRESVRYLHAYETARGTSTKRDGRAGVLVSIRLDAPGIGATAIKSIEGEVITSGYTVRNVEIKDLHLKTGKPIEHPLLKDLKITPEIETGRYPDIVLHLDGEHSRILNWFITDSKDNLLRESSDGHGKNKVSKGFSQGIPKNISLWLVVASDESDATHKFHFKDVDFP